MGVEALFIDLWVYTFINTYSDKIRNKHWQHGEWKAKNVKQWKADESLRRVKNVIFVDENVGGKCG